MSLRADGYEPAMAKKTEGGSVADVLENMDGFIPFWVSGREASEGLDPNPWNAYLGSGWSASSILDQIESFRAEIAALGEVSGYSVVLMRELAKKKTETRNLFGRRVVESSPWPSSWTGKKIAAAVVTRDGTGLRLPKIGNAI